MPEPSRWLFLSLPPKQALRLLLASILCVPAAIAMRCWGSGLPAALWLPCALLLGASVLLQRPAMGAQILARSILWSNLVLGVVIALFGHSFHEVPTAIVLAIVTGSALLLAGRIGLDEDERSPFRPVAFKWTLLAGMVLAVADAQALALFGGIDLESYSDVDRLHALALLGSASLIIVAIAGLYRLRFWGLLLNAMASTVVLVCALTDVYGLKRPLGVGLAASAALQLLLPIPIVVTIIRRQVLASRK